ncbi:YjgN family protein [Gilvimarinus japonicus]|uniref:YjgN family protein n=1 Tax=Gilvimarinus japonicus TaxID=1796469 RepID=A0ABV7HP55_9GAMM
MATPTYKIILLGAADGVTNIQAQAGFAKAFNLTPEQAAPLYANTGRVLKKGLSEEQATSYISKLATLGVACEMQQETPSAVDTAPADAPPPVTPAAATTSKGEPGSATAPRDVPFVFTGNGFEYFKIWIVNILLSIITLGIYSAWAKVRNKQYFYGNTYLDEASFSYTANPVKILIGRIIAFVFFVIYSVASELSLIAAGVMGILLLVCLPWVICKSMRFNARYSNYRNVPFAFAGTSWGAACAFVFWPMSGLLFALVFFLPVWLIFDIASAIVVGYITMILAIVLLSPYVFFKQKQFIYGNHGYGTQSFKFSATAGSYYLLFLLVIGMYVLLGLAAFFLGFVTHPFVGAALFAPVYLVSFAYFVVKVANINYNAITLKDHALRANWKLGPYLWLMVTNTLLIVITLGLFIPWAKVRTARFKAKYTSAVFVGDMNEFADQERDKVNALAEGVGDLFDIEIGL